MLCVSMLSKRFSVVCRRKGSIVRVSAVVRLGVRGREALFRVAREGGWEGVEGEVGRVCRKEVRRWELWIVRGSSERMSW